MSSAMNNDAGDHEGDNSSLHTHRTSLSDVLVAGGAADWQQVPESTVISGRGRDSIPGTN